jgi:hypothetical protein
MRGNVELLNNDRNLTLPDSHHSGRGINLRLNLDPEFLAHVATCGARS